MNEGTTILQATGNRQQATERFAGFDILKFICAFLIVCIHVQFPGYFGKGIVLIARIAVPIFFMITGYYYDNTVKRGNTKRQIKKIFLLFIEANLLYLAYRLLYAAILGDGIITYITQTFKAGVMVIFLVSNESPFAAHLWYLGAIFYVLLIAAFVQKFHLQKLMYIAVPLLLIVNVVLGEFSSLLFGQELPLVYSRNFLFVGVPYFFIGMFIKKMNITFKLKYLFISVLALFIVSVAESFLTYKIFGSGSDNYITTPFLAVAVFLLFREFYKTRSINKFEQFMANIGRKYSAWVYIIHLMISGLIPIMFNKAGILNIYEWFAPIIVFAVSVAVVAVANWMIAKGKNVFGKSKTPVKK